MAFVNFFWNTERKTCGEGVSLADFNAGEAAGVIRFHKSFREYAPTPLVSLPSLAAELGLGRILLKDESRRFGLNAFKVLGGSYAIGRILAERLHIPPENLSREELASPAIKNRLGEITFVTATDGNHGRGVAWTARQFGQKAVIFMPRGSAASRVDNIRATGAQCIVTQGNYDDTVRLANRYAEEQGGVLVQDTAWEGYEITPRHIMQGYMTLAVEILEQLPACGAVCPTHLFLQAGVGSFPGAVLGHMAAVLGADMPLTTIVEPHAAACIYKSFVARDGLPHAVSGDMPTIMAGLACGEPCTISYEVLRDYAAASVSCPDYLAANGMRILAAPRPGDSPIVSGESGAVTCGLLAYMMTTEEGRSMASRLRLDKDATVLLISTEGDTAPSLYRDIVWHGKYHDEGRFMEACSEQRDCHP
ncbi:PLP-dependent lyase/thiolase [Deltaproteobacteria bacterium]|nr:PLP-dependent lyase/thiolase [Deltaproteobacteria bacterium]